MIAKYKLLLPLLLALSVIASGCGGSATGGREQTVTVYSARHYTADNAVYEAFTKLTGIRVTEVKGTAEELVERLKREGEQTEADLLVAVDGGVMHYAKRSGVLQPVQSDVLQAQVPEAWRDPQQYWLALATRARVIVYAKDRVDPAELSTYDDLADERWRGRVLARSSANLYNQSLLASFIELRGEEQAEQWALGVVRNLAREPQGGDRDQAKAIAAGIGDVAIMNTYYIGQMLASDDREISRAAEALGVFFPDQSSTGAHVNISGAALTRHAKNEQAAIRLLEFMTSEQGQSLLTEASFEYPVNPQAAVPELLRSWGEFKPQRIDYNSLGEHAALATAIFERVGWK